jgi:L-amino acid N-acyltransferase YncA
MNAAEQVRLAATPSELACDEPDAHLVLAGDDGDAATRCSLWWRSTPLLGGRRIGAIGHFRALDGESSARLLLAACAQLEARGCGMALGPMDGNTWRRYRLVIERGDESPFFLEPDTPDHWPDCFAHAGFSVLATYCSSVQENLRLRDERLHAVDRRAAEAGIRIRTFDREDTERELRSMHELAVEAFQHGFLFSPIGTAQFLEQYTRVLPLVRDELVLIAEQFGEPVAFLFALPDALEAERGAARRTVILKTVAVRPGRAYAGLAHLLAERAATAALELGYVRAVHALMHEANSSLNWSARYGRVFRRYALLGRSL